MKSFSELERKKFDLARIGFYDIYKLENDSNLKEVWEDIRSKVAKLLEKGGLNISSFAKIFPSFEISVDVDYTWGFDPDRNSLVFHLWSLLFSTDFEIAGALIHEGDHYEFLKNHDMLGKLPQEHEEFRKEHEKSMEIRANKKQKEFLSKVRFCINARTRIKLPCREIYIEIDKYIKQLGGYLATLKKPEGLKEYDEAGSGERLPIIARCLDINLKMQPSKGYVKVIF